MQICHCKKCGFTFSRVGKVETCPDCGKKHYIFGESHLEQTAEKFGIPLTARLPIDPNIAETVDAGRVESLFELLMDFTKKLM